MFESIAIPLFLLGLSVFALFYALAPGRGRITVSGRAVYPTPVNDDVRIVALIAGGQRSIVSPNRDGRFRMDLPLGCMATIQFTVADRILRTIRLEHRQGNHATPPAPFAELFLGDIVLTSPDHRLQVQCAASFILTDTPDHVRHAPTDRCMFDRMDMLVTSPEDGGTT